MICIEEGGRIVPGTLEISGTAKFVEISKKKKMFYEFQQFKAKGMKNVNLMYINK